MNISNEKIDISENHIENNLENYDKLFNKLESNRALSQFEKHIANKLLLPSPISHDNQVKKSPLPTSKALSLVKNQYYDEKHTLSEKQNESDMGFSEFSSIDYNKNESNRQPFPNAISPAGFNKFKKLLPVNYRLPKINPTLEKNKYKKPVEKSISLALENTPQNITLNISKDRYDSVIKVRNDKQDQNYVINKESALKKKTLNITLPEQDALETLGTIVQTPNSTINRDNFKKNLEREKKNKLKPILRINESEIGDILENDTTTFIFQQYLDKINNSTSNDNNHNKQKHFQSKDISSLLVSSLSPHRSQSIPLNDSLTTPLHNKFLPQFDLEPITRNQKNMKNSYGINPPTSDRNKVKRFDSSDNNKVNQETDTKKSFIPVWLNKCGDFSQLYSEVARYDNAILIKMIFSKDPLRRINEEKKVVASWLKKVDMFRKLPLTVLEEIGGRVTLQEFKNDEIICKVGDPGKCLYIIYEGNLKAYSNKVVVATYKKFESVGRNAIENQMPRSATLIADCATTLLLLDKIDYQSILTPYLIIEKQDDANFVRNIQFFASLHPKKLKILCQHIHGKNIFKDDVGDLAECMYILKYGKLNVEHTVEIATENVWPIAKDKWEKKILTKTVVYKEPILEGQYFGHMELIKGTSRTNRVVAEKESYIIMLNRGKFFEIFDTLDIRLLSNSSVKNDPNSMLNKVLEKEENDKRILLGMIEAIKDTDTINDTQLNPLRNGKQKDNPFVQLLQKKLKNLINQNIVKVKKTEEFIVKEQF